MDVSRIHPDPVTPDAPEPLPARSVRTRKFRQKMIQWLVSLAAALLIAAVLQTMVFAVIRVKGRSMMPTLKNKERLLVTIADVRLFGARRGDVVICRYPGRGRTRFVKRVVAVPGDQVYRAEGVTYVIHHEDSSVEALDPDRSFFRPEDDYEPVTLGKEQYFVVGDNRYRSHDSRDWNDSNPKNDVGPITRNMILGRVRQVIWPPNAVRPVE